MENDNNCLLLFNDTEHLGFKHVNSCLIGIKLLIILSKNIVSSKLGSTCNRLRAINCPRSW